MFMCCFLYGTHQDSSPLMVAGLVNTGNANQIKQERLTKTILPPNLSIYSTTIAAQCSG